MTTEEVLRRIKALRETPAAVHRDEEYVLATEVLLRVCLERDRLRAVNAKLVTALEDSQWRIGYCGRGCPVCYRNETDGHAADCLIGIALSAAKEVKP